MAVSKWCKRKIVYLGSIPVYSDIAARIIEPRLVWTDSFFITKEIDE